MTTEAQTTAEPLVPGTDAYNAAMIAKAEGVTILNKGETVKPPATTTPEPDATTTTPPAPDALLAGKFKTPEELAAAYKELEAKLGAPKATTEAKTEETPPATTATPIAEAFAFAASSITPEGTLTEDALVKLETAGVSREYAQNYAEGLKAKAELAIMRIHTEAGGADKYSAMTQWAAANMTPEQTLAFDKAVTSGDPAAARGAIATLKSLYGAANGNPPAARVTGQANSGAPPNADTPFNSRAEMVKAMADPQYKKDGAYRARVALRIEASGRAGIELFY